MAGYIGTQPVPQATQTRDVFTATAGQTSFATSGYTPNFLDVYLNGVHLLNGTDYTATNGSDIVLTTGAAAGDVLEVISYSTFEVNSQNFTGDTTVANLDVTGTFTGTNLTLSGGVYLGGTGAANLLDDYEEGTFTPAFSASGYSFSYNTQIGSYVKVGKLVSVCMYLRLSASPSGSGSVALTITGLPFGIANDGNQNYTSAAILVEASGSLFFGVPFVRPNRNTTSANIADYEGGSSPNFYKSWTGMTGSMEWEIQFNYFTNA